MRRLSGLYLGIGILLCVSDGPAWAVGNVYGEVLNNIPHQSLVIQAKQLNEQTEVPGTEPLPREIHTLL
jgi:hypothetical protein